MKNRTFSPSTAEQLLGGVPESDELARLVQYYPTYEKLHRQRLLRLMFTGASHEEILEATSAAKGTHPPKETRSRGGHGLWVVSKLKRTTIRLLYLRYRLDEGLTRRQANQRLLKAGLFSGTTDAGQSSIRKATKTAVLDP